MAGNIRIYRRSSQNLAGTTPPTQTFTAPFPQNFPGLDYVFSQLIPTGWSLDDPGGTDPLYSATGDVVSSPEPEFDTLTFEVTYHQAEFVPDTVSSISVDIASDTEFEAGLRVIVPTLQVEVSSDTVFEASLEQTGEQQIAFDVESLTEFDVSFPALQPKFSFDVLTDTEFVAALRQQERVACINGLVTVERASHNRLVGICHGGFLFDSDMDGGVLSDPRRYHFFAVDREDDSFNCDPARMATDGRRVLFVNGRNGWYYDVMNPTGGVHAVNLPVADNSFDGDQSEEWADVAWLDGYFLAAAKGGQFWHTNYDSLRFDQLDFASAASGPDAITGQAVFRRRVYIIGASTIESWWNSGSANFAFSRDSSHNVNIGCRHKHTIQTNEEAVYFLGSDDVVYRHVGGMPQRVSHEGVEYDLERLSEEPKAVMYEDEGHKFYFLSVGGKAWVLDTTTGFWHEREAHDVARVNAVVGHRGRILAGRSNHGNVEEWSRAFDDPFAGRVVSPAVFDNQNRVRAHSVTVQTNADAEHSSNTATLEFSDDNGGTWVDVGTVPLQRTMRWDRLGQFSFGRNLRLTMNTGDGVPPKVLGAYMNAATGTS